MKDRDEDFHLKGNIVTRNISPLDPMCIVLLCSNYRFNFKLMAAGLGRIPGVLVFHSCHTIFHNDQARNAKLGDGNTE
jgi:hypothetical protein